MRMNASEWLYILLGCIASIVSGGVQPAFAIVFAEILNVSFLELWATDAHMNELWIRVIMTHKIYTVLHN